MAAVIKLDANGVDNVGGDTVDTLGATGKGEDVEVVSQAVKALNISDKDKEGEWEEFDIRSAILSELPLKIQQRIRALRKNQSEIFEIETKFHEEFHDLENKYEKLYQEKFEKRKELVLGLCEPSEEDSRYPLTPGGEIPGVEIVEKPSGGEKQDSKENAAEAGVPSFWSHILQSVDPVSSIIKDQDIPVLKHLTDIRAECTKEPLGFKLHFHFSPNEFFTNSVLTKTYIMRIAPDPEDILGYDGPEIISCSGCKIDWIPGKETTQKVIEKRQKHKRTGTLRTITKTVKMSTFFDFFSPPDAGKEGMNSEEAEDILDLLNEDFEIGQYLRERIIHRAILYYTGEGIAESEYDTDSETEDEEEGDEDEDEEITEQGDQN